MSDHQHPAALCKRGWQETLGKREKSNRFSAQQGIQRAAENERKSGWLVGVDRGLKLVLEGEGRRQSFGQRIDMEQGKEEAAAMKE